MKKNNRYFIVKVLIGNIETAEVGWIESEMIEDDFIKQFKALSGVDNIKILYTFELSEEKYYKQKIK